jgi:quinoprotein glucose dehydrogenase
MPVHETDTLIIGGGITSAMLAQKLAELRPGRKITIVEAGRSIFDTQNRGRYRERAMEYGEHPWHDDYIEDQQAAGIISMTMAVGGLALHWGGACNRFSEEDLRLKSMYGLATDWPIEWTELERYYCEAERRLNVSGEPSPHPEDRRSQPYPQGPIPLSYNLQILKTWAERSGIKFSPLPMARNLTPSGRTRRVLRLRHLRRGVPLGRAILAGLHIPPADGAEEDRAARPDARPQADPRRTALDHRGGARRPSGSAGRPDRVPRQDVRDRVRLLLELASLAAVGERALSDGLANRSGLVGRFMNGHSFINATANIDDQTFPGQNITHSLISREYFRCPTNRPFVRHDTRVWESSAGRDPRLRAPDGTLLLGDELMADWRSRTKGSSVRLRAYVDVHPSADSRLTLDPSKKNRYGDPMPKIEHRLDDATRAREAATRAHVQGVFATLAKASNGRIVNNSEGDYLDHPGGGCRMGTGSRGQRVRQFRPHPRPREPVRRRRADDADRRVHERDAHVRRVDVPIGGRDRASV